MSDEFFREEVESMSRQFLMILRSYLEPQQWSEFVHKTRAAPMAKACYSHDYCDANMAMQEAMESEFTDIFDSNGEMRPDMMRLWSASWVRALEIIRNG